MPLSAWIGPLLGLLASVLGGLALLVIKRLYHSVDLLFAEVKSLRAQQNRIQSFLVSKYPDETFILRAMGD